MNDDAREVLVQAALSGHRQVKGLMHDWTHYEGECGLGVLHLTMHNNRREALHCRMGWESAINNGDAFEACWVKTRARYGITSEDRGDMILGNDMHGWDFLTLAHKVGVDHDA